MAPQQGATPDSSRPGSFIDKASPTLSVPNSAMDKTPDDASRLKTFLSILKQYVFLDISPLHAVVVRGHRITLRGTTSASHRYTDLTCAGS